VLTNMVLRRRVARGVTTHFDSYTSSSTRIPNKGRIPGKIFRVQTGRIPSWTYSKADVYRGTTVLCRLEAGVFIYCIQITLSNLAKSGFALSQRTHLVIRGKLVDLI
jgi:hypothetical protein